MSDHPVPPGDLPVPGWYADPGDPGRTRYWDGRSWTDQTGPAPVPPGAAAGPAPVPVVPVRSSSPGPRGCSGLGCLLVAAATAAVLVVIVVVANFAARHPPAGGSDLDASAATYVCRELVRDRLRTPGSGTFSEEDAEPPVAGTQWTVTGRVASLSAQGKRVQQDYLCVVEPDDRGYWRLVRLHFS